MSRNEAMTDYDFDVHEATWIEDRARAEEPNWFPEDERPTLAECERDEWLLNRKEATVLMDDVDRERLAGKSYYIGANGYAYLSFWVDGRSVPDTLHAWILGGSIPGMHIDHINGNKLDNRRCNLRDEPRHGDRW